MYVIRISLNVRCKCKLPLNTRVFLFKSFLEAYVGSVVYNPGFKEGQNKENQGLDS